MNLDSYSIQQLENIDFRSNFGKKLKSEMGISSKEIKKKIHDLIEKRREDNKRTESKDYQDMIKLLPDKFINIRQSQFHNYHLNCENDEEIENSENDIDNIDLTMDENSVNEDMDNIDFTCEESENFSIPCNDFKMNLDNTPTIKTVETETNSVNYIVQLFNQDETVQLKLTRDQFINFATNNGYSQEFILDFLNQGNQNNVCKIDEFQWLNDDFLFKFDQQVGNIFTLLY